MVNWSFDCFWIISCKSLCKFRGKPVSVLGHKLLPMENKCNTKYITTQLQSLSLWTNGTSHSISYHQSGLQDWTEASSLFSWQRRQLLHEGNQGKSTVCPGSQVTSVLQSKHHQPDKRQNDLRNSLSYRRNVSWDWCYIMINDPAKLL